MWLKFILGLILCSSFYWFNSVRKQDFIKTYVLKPPDVEVTQPPSRSLLNVYVQAAVCTDKYACSRIGSVILQREGNAIDAAIASLLCNGLVTMQSMGIGGGVVMTVYKRKERKSISIIGREKAPANIKLKEIAKLKSAKQFATSPLSIGVPGELAAYHEAHRRYGSLPWSHIMRPILEICYNGYQLTRHQYDALFLNEDMIRQSKILAQMFVDSKTDLFYKEGSYIKFPPQVCATYKSLAVQGPMSFYNGSLAPLVAKDLNEIGSPITIDDLHTYKADVRKSIKLDLDPFYIYLPQPPGSGHVIGFIMKLLRYFRRDFSLANDLNTLEVHRVIEALKFGFVKRWQYDTDIDDKTLKNMLNTESIGNLSLLIDDTKTFDSPQHYGSQVEIIPTEDYGTAQISVLAPNGDAVSATSSLNYYFGSGRAGAHTGVLFNNAMSDFTLENFENYFNLPNIKTINELSPQKQPMSSMAPLIVTNKLTGNVKVVVGAAGGSRIISTLVQILVRVLWQEQNIKQAIDAPRFHHQLLPNILEYEFGMLQPVVQDLRERGHKTERVRRKSTAVCGVERVKDGIVLANADYRKEAAIYNSLNFAYNIVEKWQTSPIITVMNPGKFYVKKEPFPAVTICNMNQAQYSKVKDFDKKSLEYAMLQKSCLKEMNYSSFWYKQPHPKVHTFAKFIVKNSQPCSQMLRSCKYGHIEIACTDLFREILMDEGLCCSFNIVHPHMLYKGEYFIVRDFTSYNGPSIPLDWSPEKGYPKKLPYSYYPRMPLGSGRSKGLTIILDGDYDNYFCSSTNGAGFKVALHNPIDTPNIKDTGLFLSLGYQTSFRIISVREDIVKSLRVLTRPKERQCYFSDEYPLKYFRYYTRRNCERECEAEFMLRRCNCIPHYMPLLSKTVTACHVKNFDCVLEAERDFVDESRLSCYQKCLHSCFDIAYYPKPNFAPLANKGFRVSNPYLSSMSKENLSNHAVLTIYFPQSYYRGNLKSPYIGVTEFLAQVGGIMSLMMGFSIISLVEFTYFFIIKPLFCIYRKVFYKNSIDVVKMGRSDVIQVNQIPNLMPYNSNPMWNTHARPQWQTNSQHTQQLNYLP